MKQFELELLLKYPKGFIDIFSKYYPIPETAIRKYGELWNWEALSCNENLPWNDNNFIEEFKDIWNWEELIKNKNFPLNAEIVEKYKHKWNNIQSELSDKKWLSLISHPLVVSNPNLFNNCLLYWDEWCEMQASKADVNWESLSSWVALSKNFIRKYQDKLNWKNLSYNQNLPWNDNNFIEEFKDRWNWKFLSANEGIVWTIGMIEIYTDKLPWIYTLEDSYSDDGDVIGLYNNPGFIWTVDLFKRYKEEIHKEFKQLEKEYKGLWGFKCKHHWISHHKTNNWSYEFLQYILEGKDENCSIADIDWLNICMYGRCFWEDEFIQKYKDKFGLDLDELANNPYFPWNKYLNLLSPHIDELVRSILIRNCKLEWNTETEKLFKGKWTQKDFEKDIISAFTNYDNLPIYVYPNVPIHAHISKYVLEDTVEKFLEQIRLTKNKN